jgi:hypothetical protein
MELMVPNCVRIAGNYHWGNHGHRLQELKDRGLIYGQDYTWGYYPSHDSRWDDDFNLVAGSDSYTEIEFQDPALATYYQLRWG